MVSLHHLFAEVLCTRLYETQPHVIPHLQQRASAQCWASDLPLYRGFGAGHGLLIVSTSTVKTHINHIFGKLAVQSRAQAIARAHALGLFNA